MKNKVNISEGLESLERILLMMKYDNKKTLSENYNLLNEQSNLKIEGPFFSSDNKVVPEDYIVPRKFDTKKNAPISIYLKVQNNFTEPLVITDIKLQEDTRLDLISFDKNPIKPNSTGKINFNITYVPECNDDFGLTNREISINTTKGVFKKNIKLQYNNTVSDDEIEYCKKLEENAHTVLDWGSIITGVAGLAFPPLLAVSFGLEVLNGYLYLSEGDDYMAGLTFALSVLPFSEMLPKGIIKKPIKIVSKEILDLLKSTGKWSDELLKKMSPDASKLVEWISKNFNKIYKMSKNKFDDMANVFRFIKDKADIPIFLSKLFTILKKTGKFLGVITVKGVIPAGGIIIGWNTLYNWLSSKSNDDLQKTLESGHEGMMKDFENWKKSQQNTQSDNNQTIEKPENGKINKFSWINSPNIEEIKSGKRIISKGMTGDSVRFIQELLKNKGYTINVDSKFGKETDKVVKQFQTDKSLRVDGKVGIETYNKLSE